MIVVLADVSQDEGGNASVQMVLDEIGGNVIRQVSAAAHDSLLHAPGIRAHTQHFQVVIRFEQNNIGAAQVNLKRIGNVAEISRERDLDAFGANAVADGIGSIVRNRETPDVEVANGEIPASLKDFERWREFAPIEERHGAFGEIDGQRPASMGGDGTQPAGVVCMLVREKDRVEGLDVFADGSQAFSGFAPAQTGIDQDSCAAAREERRVARTAASQDAELYDNDGPQVQL
jgi:hypothetical protein